MGRVNKTTFPLQVCRRQSLNIRHAALCHCAGTVMVVIMRVMMMIRSCGTGRWQVICLQLRHNALSRIEAATVGTGSGYYTAVHCSTLHPMANYSRMRPFPHPFHQPATIIQAAGESKRESGMGHAGPHHVVAALTGRSSSSSLLTLEEPIPEL
jgi:hypothetical protein